MLMKIQVIKKIVSLWLFAYFKLIIIIIIWVYKINTSAYFNFKQTAARPELNCLEWYNTY